MIVNGAVIDQRSIWINDEHVRRCFGRVEVAQRSAGIHQHRGRRGVHRLEIIIFLRRRNKSLRSRERTKSP